MSNKEKMEKVLKGYQRALRHLQKQSVKTLARLRGAQREILVRRFEFDLENLQEEKNKVKGKIAWAKRMLHEIDHKNNTNEEGDLVHRPFAVLKNFKLG